MDNNWLKNVPCVIDKYNLRLQLKDYKRVNDKISYMIANGELIPMIKGKYISTVAYHNGNVSKFNIANSLYGPSYVSSFTAMSYHQMIPEKVVLLESVTTLRSKKIDTPIGKFAFQKTPVSSFHIGITQIAVDQSSFLIATPTKALIDALWITKVRDVYGVQGMANYLFDNLRIDEDIFSKLDISIVAACLEHGKKKRLLSYLFKLLQKY